MSDISKELTKKTKMDDESVNINLDLTSKLTSDSNGFTWEEVGDGQVFVMTTETCKGSKKVGILALIGIEMLLSFVDFFRLPLLTWTTR